MIDYQVNFLEQTKGNLISQRQAMVEAELGKIIHDYVVLPELPHINTQYINRVYSDYLDSGENDEILEVEYSNLFSVANQCPAAGGQSVYRARAMLALLNDSIEYNDANVCLQSGIYKEGISESMINEFELIPNPASDHIIIKFKKPTTGLCYIRINNSLGSNLMSFRLNCEIVEHDINVMGLETGVYFVEVKYENSVPQTKKLIILK
jgi:hypothetical protein